MAKPKFGFHYSRIENVIPPPDFAHLAEEMEFDSVWVPEALVNEVPAGDIMMTMSALVHHSSSITVGAGAVLLPLRNPVVLAKEFATLDIHSEGRIIVGFGVGGPPDSHPDAFEACGVSLRERGNLTDEALEIMTKLWTGEAVDHQGEISELFQHPPGTEAVSASSPTPLGRRRIRKNAEAGGPLRRRFLSGTHQRRGVRRILVEDNAIRRGTGKGCFRNVPGHTSLLSHREYAGGSPGSRRDGVKPAARVRGFFSRRWQICLRDCGRLHKDGGEIPGCRCRPHSVQRHDACR